MTADLIDQAFAWLKHPLHASLLAALLSVPTLLWRLMIYGTIHGRTPSRDCGESGFSFGDGCNSDGCGDGGVD